MSLFWNAGLRWEWINDCGLRSRCGDYAICRIPSRGIYELWRIHAIPAVLLDTHYDATVLMRVATDHARAQRIH